MYNADVYENDYDDFDDNDDFGNNNGDNDDDDDDLHGVVQKLVFKLLHVENLLEQVVQLLLAHHLLKVDHHNDDHDDDVDDDDDDGDGHGHHLSHGDHYHSQL